MLLADRRYLAVRTIRINQPLQRVMKTKFTIPLFYQARFSEGGPLAGIVDVSGCEGGLKINLLTGFWAMRHVFKYGAGWYLIQRPVPERRFWGL